MLMLDSSTYLGLEHNTWLIFTHCSGSGGVAGAGASRAGGWCHGWVCLVLDLDHWAAA